MPGPVVSETAFTERKGIRKVDDVVSDARCVWRETPTRDIGIDGQIEHLNANREATGRIVAVQVKSGVSYFAGETETMVPFTPSAEHAPYWESFAIPVILVLHDPTRNLTLWADARGALRDGHRKFEVPKAQALDAAGVLRALESGGPLPVGVASDAELVRLMLNSKSPDHGFDVSVFELFFQGLTDGAGSVYFGMDLFQHMADVKAALPGRNGKFSFEADTFAFIDAYVAFLVAHDLARIDFDHWRRTNLLRRLVGRFLSPLTNRGRALVEYISSLDDKLGRAGYRRVAQERFVSIEMTGIDERTEHIDLFVSQFDELATGAPVPSGPSR